MKICWERNIDMNEENYKIRNNAKINIRERINTVTYQIMKYKDKDRHRIKSEQIPGHISTIQTILQISRACVLE